MPPPSKPAPWWGIIGLAYFALTIFAYALYSLLKTNDTQLVSNMIIAVIGFVATALGFYFGSSSNSGKKDDQAAALGAALASSTPASNSPPSSLVAAMVESQAAHQ
jgi:hypothetical protein